MQQTLISDVHLMALKYIALCNGKKKNKRNCYLFFGYIANLQKHCKRDFLNKIGNNYY